MGPIGQPELVGRVDKFCQKQATNKDEVVRLRGENLLLGKHKGSFRERCAQWLKRTFGKSEFKSYREYLDSVTARESDALATALARALSKRTVKPCTLSGKVTVADLTQTIDKTRKDLADFDSIVKQVVKPALKGDALTSDPLDGPKTVLRTALMDRKITRPEQLHELRSVFSQELKVQSGREDEKHRALRLSLTKRMSLAINDLTLTMQLFREALDYIDRQQLMTDLEKERETVDRPDGYVYIEDTPDRSTDDDGMIIKLAKKTIDHPEGIDPSPESVSGRIDETMAMLKQKYPNIQPVHVRGVRDYLESHFSTSPTTPQPISEPSPESATPYAYEERPSSIAHSESRVSLSVEELDEEEDNISVFSFINDTTSPTPELSVPPDSLPEEPLAVSGQHKRVPSESSSGVVSDFSRQGSVNDEQDLSGIDLDQYAPLADNEPENLKARSDRLGSSDSGVGFNSEQDSRS